MIRNVNQKWKPKQMAIKDEKGEVLVDRVEVETLQRWTSYCSELYKETLDTDVLENLVAELRKIFPPSVENEYDIIRKKVERAVKWLKDNKGHDKITGEMIKHGGESLIDEIHQVCNEVWKQGKILKEWAKSVLVAIHKKGSMLECKNYRTIALTSHIGKILMMILKEGLSSLMEEHLADEQAGFRKDRSTTQQILTLRLLVEKTRKQKNIYSCFVDFQKAFDSIDQKFTLAVLKSYGMDHN
ncbi:uncharacterized protein LOC111615539 [Centruroides sculpturatus]|uniref:uncharacterized protein LOC111615539 n=1 Tax=Centruroides sculpturatus TaxID=218467 RepID=UPI000C6C9A53|nr:uncharacterized protein LOC111615539 [Centruroides sculpturatus]